MATKFELQFFKDIYDAETARYRELIDRGKIYLTIVAAYTGLFAFTSDKIPHFGAHLYIAIPFWVVACSMLTALGLIVRALGIYKYEDPFDPEVEATRIDSEKMSEKVFIDYRIADFVVAYGRNEIQNDKRADALRLSTIFISIGIFCHLIFIFVSTR